jgi:hypothetical protein
VREHVGRPRCVVHERHLARDLAAPRCIRSVSKLLRNVP